MTEGENVEDGDEIIKHTMNYYKELNKNTKNYG